MKQLALSPSRSPRLNAPRTAAMSMLLLAVFAGGCKHPKPIAPAPVRAPEAAPVRTQAQRPTINSFTAEPSSVEKGQAVTLRWSISGATDMSIDNGLGAVQSQGQRQIFPNQVTTYTLTASGPGGTDTRTVNVDVTQATTAAPPPSNDNGPRLSSADILARDVKDVFFDYDKSDISGAAQGILTRDAEVLRRVFGQDQGILVSIEGHCDERGSAEYNLGLADRRATSVREYLVQLGVSADRLKTISYGKEKPQCTDATESCYASNRRAHFTAGGQ